LSLSREDFFKEFSNIRLRRVNGESSTYARDALFLINNGKGLAFFIAFLNFVT